MVEKNAHDNEEDDINEDEKVNGALVSHSAAKDASMHVTPMDVLWANKWSDASTKSRLAKLKQKEITEFFQ